MSADISCHTRRRPQPDGPMRRTFLRWFHREFFADFELGTDGRFRVPVSRIPEPPEQRGAPTAIDACASYY